MATDKSQDAPAYESVTVLDTSIETPEILPSVRDRWLVFAGAFVLVSVPVFVQAPLVRSLPWLSLAITPCLFWLAKALIKQPRLAIWGDLLMGFNWTWLTGAIYWGWFRWEPLVHLPIEAIGLPFAIYWLYRQQGKVGNWFYLGSLFGTAVTDLYFYLMNLIPYWRKLMQADVSMVRPIFHSALVEMQTPRGASYAVVLLSVLFAIGFAPLCYRQLHWWAFGGAVLSTILVDGLFWLAAVLA
ncbi:DUF3120 domain-containing protein [Leptolyngbya sp. AN02str]|uniref:DUF3120 domain-containing protein n=1 Tax=Leptolyngbya sp. AN02str TaxID=3423363 RepID=UPI003D31D97E